MFVGAPQCFGYRPSNLLNYIATTFAYLYTCTCKYIYMHPTWQKQYRTSEKHSKHVFLGLTSRIQLAPHARRRAVPMTESWWIPIPVLCVNDEVANGGSHVEARARRQKRCGCNNKYSTIDELTPCGRRKTSHESHFPLNNSSGCDGVRPPSVMRFCVTEE